MKKILLVAYHFPPDTAVGAVRPAKFAKYLPEFGWEPVILSVKERYYAGLSRSESKKTGSILKVVRTTMFKNPSYYYRKLKRQLRIDQENNNASGPVDQIENGSTLSGLRARINFLLSFPDEQAGWLPFAVFQGLRLIHREKIAVLISSGPPHSVHLIGACLSKLTRIPWIADFRDPYLDDVFKDQPGIEKGFTGCLTRKLDSWFISKAATVLTTTDRFSACLRSRYPVHQQKIFTLPNGYDSDDFLKIRSEKEKDFTISYFGSLYERRDPEPVLRAISELIHEKLIDPGRLILRFIGSCEYVQGKTMSSLISKYGLNNNVKLLSWISRGDALELMVRTHVLLLLAENQPLAIPGKVYDYLATGSDILAITGDGATADILREIGTGIVVSPDDDQGLKAKIKTLYKKYLAECQHHSEDSSFVGNGLATKYSRKYLTEELVRLLEAVGYSCSHKQT